ncbi:hypothetical protein J6590_103857 [Homalodisca vitripennis]|nr:hypothetical protein J6590_103857 [Homalodisca vitripennis]
MVIKLELLLTSTPRLGVSTTLPERPTPSKEGKQLIKTNKHLIKQNIKLELLLTSTPRLGVSTTLPERPTPSKGQWALQPINHTHTLYKTHMSRGDIGIEPAQTPPQKEELPSVNFFKMKNQTKCLSPQWENQENPVGGKKSLQELRGYKEENRNLDQEERAETKEKSRMTPARLQMGYVRLPENLLGLRISQSGSHRSQKLQDAVGTSPPVA